ncbi:unnamed protein product [Clonostachys chloroleuca]|uniref:Uncharacterized protein n=1 Tax=Clonostachys chloroleuca TaxID=1926264 RepID=A0AA35M9T3_9HYPO|nr:unnamed protein product [Clonostachys chloroleuca]
MDEFDIIHLIQPPLKPFIHGHFRGQNISLLGKYRVPSNTNLPCTIKLCASQYNFSLDSSDFFHLLSPMIIDEIPYRITFLFHNVFKFSH